VAGEKYIVAASENPAQILVRNMLNPLGYIFLGNCMDAVSLMRLIRSYQPDFIVVDTSIKLGEFRKCLEAVDDEMLCACVIIGDYKDAEIISILENSRIISFCPKPLSQDLLVNTVDMGLMYYRRMLKLNKELKEIAENYETRKSIERAKCILMNKYGLSENEAYEKMRKKSMNTRNSLKSIAESIILADGMMDKVKGQ
jgi:AmiR/NasT family two-component response regulator